MRHDIIYRGGLTSCPKREHRRNIAPCAFSLHHYLTVFVNSNTALILAGNGASIDDPLRSKQLGRSKSFWQRGDSGFHVRRARADNPEGNRYHAVLRFAITRTVVFADALRQR